MASQSIVGAFISPPPAPSALTAGSERRQRRLRIQREGEDRQHERHDHEASRNAISRDSTPAPTRLCMVRMNIRSM